MIEVNATDRELLGRVCEQLVKIPASIDYLLLIKWRVYSICQYLLGGSSLELEKACRLALEAFLSDAAGAECEKALKSAGVSIRQVECPRESSETVLPLLSKEKCSAISGFLDLLADGKSVAIERALHVLPTVQAQISNMTEVSHLPGIQYRFRLIKAVLMDQGCDENYRIRAAAAVLCINKINNAIPDTLNVIGLIDDDYALRLVLEEIYGTKNSSYIHWSEKISSLWVDLPLLRGVKLKHDNNPISVTWLDRVNSFISYLHVFNTEKKILILLQPSIACSPLHMIISLIGLLVLDAVTSSNNQLNTLRPGQTYVIDGTYVQFEGYEDQNSTRKGWLRLLVRGCIEIQKPDLANRMVPVDKHRLSSVSEYSSHARTAKSDPLQLFFDWDHAIEPSSITSLLVIVASRQRALEVLKGVQSNGVHLLKHGFVRFISVVPKKVDIYGSLVLVVPSLSTVRILLGQNINIQTVLIDGYDHLNSGRHDLPFLKNRQKAPAIIVWSVTGYYPEVDPKWLPPHIRNEVSVDELADILELDDECTDLINSSLWEAATGGQIHVCIAPLSLDEKSIIVEVNNYINKIKSSKCLPEYWKYHLMTFSRKLKNLVAANPTEWSEIKYYITTWSLLIDEKYSRLRPSASQDLASLRDAEKHIMSLINKVVDTFNSRANGVVEFLTLAIPENDSWYFVCDCSEQVKVATSAFHALKFLPRIQPILLRDLSVCLNCVVVGWVSSSFMRRLKAHTPRKLVAIIDEDDRWRWECIVEAPQYNISQTMLGAISGDKTKIVPRSSSPPHPEDENNDEYADGDEWDPKNDTSWDNAERVPCVLLWMIGEPKVKVLEPHARVIVEEDKEGDKEGDKIVCERVATRLRPYERVILSLGVTRWSPAEEFTNAIVDAVRTSNPDLVRAAKVWRQSLCDVINEKHLSIIQLRDLLASLGIEREIPTIEGWLDIERASPIAPRGMNTELLLLWPLIEKYVTCSFDEVSAACGRLRSLRTESGRALLQHWKGRSTGLEIEEIRLDEIVGRLRQKVHVYEIEAIVLGQLPSEMIGWWIPRSMAENIEMITGNNPYGTSEDGEDASF